MLNCHFSRTDPFTRTNLAETINASSPVNYQWSYDNLYRLTNEVAGSMGHLAYGYDAVGNRTNRSGSLGSLGAQMPGYNTNDWLTTDTYDTNGNTSISAGIMYKYDALNRLISVGTGGTNFLYDADGNRISKTIQISISPPTNVTTYYLIDDRNPSGYAQVVEEYQQTNDYSPWILNRVYNYGLALISQQQINTNTLLPGATSYYGYDGHGSVRFLTGTNGIITDTYTYDAYGTLIASSGSTPNLYRYSGQQYDPDLGLYYNRARYLNTDTGRFWSMDSYGGNSEEPLSLHKYLYCQDNPVNNIDPDGEMSMAELNFTMFLAATLLVFDLEATHMAQTHALGNLSTAVWTETMTETGSSVDAADAALAVYSTSVDALIKQARNVLKNSGKRWKKVKVVPMPKSIIPKVANHIAVAQASGYSMAHIRVSKSVADANRRFVTWRLGSAGAGQQWDEYPLASGRPLRMPASVVAVPQPQNSMQGYIIRACYKKEKITPGIPFLVVVTP